MTVIPAQGTKNTTRLTIELDREMKQLFRNALFIIMFMLVGLPTVQAAGNLADGKIKAVACQVCHGPGGKSTNPLYPVLSGQHAKYIIKQLKAFREGTRSDPIMNGMAKDLSDQDIEDLATYFNSTR